MQTQTTNKKIPIRIVMWVIDKQNLIAVPFVFNADETKVKNLLTGEVCKLCEKGLTRFYADKNKVDFDLVHIGKLDSLTNYLTCGVSLSENLKIYYEIIRKSEHQESLDKRALVTNLFMKKSVDELELTRITQDLTLGIRRMHIKTLKDYTANKQLAAEEKAVRNF